MSLNSEEVVISPKLHDKLCTNSFTFAVRFSSVLAEVKAPGDESGDQDEVYQIRNDLLSGLLSMPNWP